MDKHIKNGLYTKEDYDYMVSIGKENPNYKGFLAVAYSVINRKNFWKKSIKDIVSKKGQFAGFLKDEIGKPRNNQVKLAAISALANIERNPIKNSTYFFGRVNGYDLWYESSKVTYLKEVSGNVFYNEKSYGKVHNMLSNKTSDAIIIYDVNKGK